MLCYCIDVLHYFALNNSICKCVPGVLNYYFLKLGLSHWGKELKIMERKRQTGIVSWFGLAFPLSCPPHTYFCTDISCHGRVKINKCLVMESRLVLIFSVQSMLIQILIINSASGGCVGADVLAENKSLLWHLEDFIARGPQPDHKEILVNTGTLLPLAIYLLFGGWHSPSTIALPWALHC